MRLTLQLPGSKKTKDVTYAAVEVDSGRSDADASSQRSLVTGWPTVAQPLSTSPFWILADILLLLMPISFIALAGLAYKLNGKPLSDYGERITDAILLGPTLFPLAFAALGGRSLKKIGLWKAEKGTTLGFLEHIIGSQSLVAAVGHAITLHSWNFLALALLIFWALSPLGGQSALRLVHTTNSTVSETSPIFYSDVNAASHFPDESYNEDMVNQVNAVILTSLMTANTLDFSPVDTWNHPKIPRIAALEEESAKNGTDTPWYDVKTQANQTYAALTGIDLLNLKNGDDANFTIPYEYMHFDCDMRPSPNPLKTATDQMDYMSGLNNASRLESGDQFVWDSNGTSWTIVMKRGFFIYGISDGITAEKLLYGSQLFGGSIYLFECSMNSVLLEANIKCTSEACEAKRLRRLRTPRAERNSTNLPYDVVRDGFTFKYFIRHLVELGGTTSNGGTGSVGRANPIDDYVYGASPWGVEETGRAPVHNWTEYIGNPEKTIDMSRRLTKLLNTYWDASRWPVAIIRNDPFGKASLNATSGEPFASLTMNKADAVITSQILIYKAEVPWVISLIVCSSILLILGLFGFVLSVRITAPDIFDYVSSFTRDNPYIDAPAGGSGLDGADRARLLRRLPVQLGDVRPDEDEGYVALKSFESKEDAILSRLKRERVYR